MRPPTTPSRSAMLTSVRTCMPTLSCLEAPPCTLVLLTGCRRRSLLLLHPPSRSRSLLPQRGSTPSGSEDQSLLPSPPSSRCGSPSRSMMSAAHPLFTASASKEYDHHHPDCVENIQKCVQTAMQMVAVTLYIPKLKKLNNSFGNILKEEINNINAVLLVNNDNENKNG